MLSSAIAESALSRGSSNRKSVWSTWTARSITDQAWHVVSRFTGLQQHACFVAGSLAFKRGRGERAIARLEQSPIWMVNLDCAINYRSSLECCVKIYGPAAACVLCSWSACPQARPRRARRRESRPITNLDGRFRLRDRLPIKLGVFVKICGPAAAGVLCSWFACFQARSRRVRYREARAIANLYGQPGLRDQSQINLAVFCQDLRARSSMRAL